MGEQKPLFETKEITILGTRWMKTACIHIFNKSDGSPGQWESIKGSDVPTVLLCGLTKNKELVLVNLFRFPVSEFCTELPGGTVELGESNEAAVIREFTEETGYQPARVSKLCGGFLWNGKSNQQFLIMLGEDCEKVSEPNLDLVEQLVQLRVVLHKPHRVKALIADGVMTFDPPIAQAILAMESKGII